MRSLPDSRKRVVFGGIGIVCLAMAAVGFFLADVFRDGYLADLEGQMQREAVLLAGIASARLEARTDAASQQSVLAQLPSSYSQLPSRDSNPPPQDSHSSARHSGPSTGHSGPSVRHSREGGSPARVTVILADGTVVADTAEGAKAAGSLLGRPEIRDALNEGMAGSMTLRLPDGEEVVYGTAPVQQGGRTVGVVRLEVPASAIQDDVNLIRYVIAFFALTVIVFSAVVAYILALRTSRSVRAVTDAAQRLAQGDLDQRVAPSVEDETRELANAFNRMAAALRTSINDLSDERAKLAAIFNTMADGVVVIGEDGRVQLTNQAAETLLGVNSYRIEGHRFIEAVRDHELQQLLLACLNEREPRFGEIELLRPRRFLSAIAIPLNSEHDAPSGHSREGGNPTGAGGVLLNLHDLTRMRQVETTRREFVSNVSHELRSPIASVKALVESLEDGAVEERETARDFLQRIHREVDRMSNLVAELLHLARLETGQESLDLRTVDLKSMIEELLSDFQASADAGRVVLRSDVADNVPPVVGDEEKLRQSLVNLMSNALKFTPEHGEITVLARAHNGSVEVCVEDTGIGIAREHLAHIFERFYKVDRARRDGGTGLGLAIVKHIVEAHGGEVLVESHEGSGSTFGFTVPRAD